MRYKVIRVGLSALALAVSGLVLTSPPSQAASPTCNSTSNADYNYRGLTHQTPVYRTSSTLTWNCALRPSSSFNYATKMLQFHLYHCSPYTRTILGGSNGIDGYYGPRTVEAVKAVQRAWNARPAPEIDIAVDGVYGPQTRKHMLWLYRDGSCWWHS